MPLSNCCMSYVRVGNICSNCGMECEIIDEEENQVEEEGIPLENNSEDEEDDLPHRD